jgi:hypothetical protein
MMDGFLLYHKTKERAWLIDVDVEIVIVRMNRHNARVFLRSLQTKEALNLSDYTITIKDSLGDLVVSLDNKNYVIAWLEDYYEIYSGSIKVLAVTNQRQQSIQNFCNLVASKDL